MTEFRILPQEMNEEPTLHRIKTRVPFAEITDHMVAVRAKAANLSAGDQIRVMATSHDYDEVLAQSTYLVTRRKDGIARVESEDGRDIRQINTVDISVARLGEWMVFVKPAAAEPAAAEADAKPKGGKKAA